jgi:hypothetical protein
LATENPRKYIQEESPASPPQVERFYKASPSLGVDMENGSRMRRTQKGGKNTTKTTTSTAAEEARLGLPCNPGRRKREEGKTKKNKRTGFFCDRPTTEKEV